MSVIVSLNRALTRKWFTSLFCVLWLRKHLICALGYMYGVPGYIHVCGGRRGVV